MLNLDYPQLLVLFRDYLDPKRTESASFLIWYLEHYYRLDALDVVDCVCDQSGDKGIDGIYVNEGANSIDVFQSRLFQANDRTLGDASLREFRGTLSQFDSQGSLQNLVDTAGEAEVARLITRLDLVKKLPTYHVRGIFLTNADPDANANAYLATEPSLNVVGKTELAETFISDARDIPPAALVTFDISGLPISKYVVDANTRAVIAPIKARELVSLAGIADQSVFAFNVRGPLGRTQVNRDIVSSIKDPSTHKLFPLFHNGITIISEKVADDVDKITIENYHVVNGCQSLSALYNNRASVTDDLRILTKILEMEIGSQLSEKVTRFSNNQNGVKARDFKSNSPVQIRLQNEFRQKYEGLFALEIKRGEHPGKGEVISNENAGLYLMAFDLGEPWGTHRKYELFDDKHADLFARPEVTADRILMCHILTTTIVEKAASIENSLFGKYALTKFVILFMLRRVMDADETGGRLIANPVEAVKDEPSRQKLETVTGRIVDDMIIDINHEVREFGDDFDYRGKLRDATWVKDLAKAVVGAHEKLVQRGRVPSLHTEWAGDDT